MSRAGRAGRPRGALLLALGLALALLPGRGDAAGPPVKVRPETLSDVRRRLDAAREQASAARRREASLLAELETIDRTLARKRRTLADLDRRLRGVEAELAVLEGRRDQVAEDLVARQAALARRLAALARLRSVPAPPGWLADAEALARQRAAADLARVVGADLAALARADATAERLASRQEATARARGRLVALRRQADAERAAIETQADRRRRLLAQVREDRATHERVAAELAEAARRLERLVRSLARRPPARRAVARPATPRPPAVGLGRERGRLPWPTEGRVVAGFGREVHPRFGTEIVRSGIVIEAPEGAAIRAVAPGTVAYRGWLRGYGNLVVLDHGNGYHTLYAHASEVLVEEGDQVTAGELIGRVGESGSVEGPRLHFELRYQSRAVDPQDWLRRRP